MTDDDFKKRYAAFVEDVKEIRAEQDEIDRQIIDLLAKRYQCRDKTMPLKIKHNIPVEVGLRVDEIIDRVSGLAQKAGVPKRAVCAIFEQIMDFSMDYEDDYREKLNANK